MLTEPRRISEESEEDQFDRDEDPVEEFSTNLETNVQT